MAYENLEKLAALRQSGVITEAEFEAEKAKLLASPARSSIGQGAREPARSDYWGMSESTFSLAMYLCLLLVFIPVVSWLLPIVMWLTQKDRSATIDAHGKNILNFEITALIYGAAVFLLTFVFIGVLLAPVLGFACFIVVIIGGVKASQGVVWKFPVVLAFRFFR